MFFFYTFFFAISKSNLILQCKKSLTNKDFTKIEGESGIKKYRPITGLSGYWLSGKNNRFPTGYQTSALTLILSIRCTRRHVDRMYLHPQCPKLSKLIKH